MRAGLLIFMIQRGRVKGSFRVAMGWSYGVRSAFRLRVKVGAMVGVRVRDRVRLTEASHEGHAPSAKRSRCPSIIPAGAEPSVRGGRGRGQGTVRVRKLGNCNCLTVRVRVRSSVGRGRALRPGVGGSNRIKFGIRNRNMRSHPSAAATTCGDSNKDYFV